MKITDEHRTTVYFNIPHDAVVTASDTDIRIQVADKPYMRFGKASAFQRKASSYFWLTDEEFSLLQKEIEQQFAKPIPAPPIPPWPRSVKGETANV